MKLKQRQFFGRFDNFLIFSRFFLELRSKGLYPSSEQEKENRCLAFTLFTLFTFFTKCEIRKFHVWSRDDGKELYQKMRCTYISLPSLHDYDVVQIPRFMKT